MGRNRQHDCTSSISPANLSRLCLFLAIAVLPLMLAHLPAPKAEVLDAELYIFTLNFAVQLELPGARFEGTEHERSTDKNQALGEGCHVSKTTQSGRERGLPLPPHPVPSPRGCAGWPLPGWPGHGPSSNKISPAACFLSSRNNEPLSHMPPQ